MGALLSTAKKLSKQKLELGKIRRSSEKEFKKAKAASRKYSSSLTSLEKRVNSSREHAEDLGQIKGGTVHIDNLPYHQDIANMAGTSRETVSRVLKTLEEKKYLKRRGRKTVIRNFNKFCQLFS